MTLTNDVRAPRMRLRIAALAVGLPLAFGGVAATTIAAMLASLSPLPGLGDGAGAFAAGAFAGALAGAFSGVFTAAFSGALATGLVSVVGAGFGAGVEDPPPIPSQLQAPRESGRTRTRAVARSGNRMWGTSIRTVAGG